jgi:glycosyltransferase involved in cell wall biosynthesis
MDRPVNNHTKLNIAIISSCTEEWGGSEELWGKSVPFLLKQGYTVTVYKNWINKQHPKFIDLAKQGALLQNIDIPKPFLKRNLTKIWNKFNGLNTPFTLTDNPWVHNLIELLKLNKPVFAIVSQGINFDGLAYAYACKAAGIPYTVIAQKAVDFYWPTQTDRPVMLDVLQHARACYFVSKHNLRLTEEQFGKKLPNGHVIFNPLKVGKVQPYPDTSNGIRLACVGRLFLLDKGQDILIRVLSKPQWKERPITVTFVGTGIDEAGLKDLAVFLDVNKVSFAGQVNDIDALWQQHHALILPSRSEGLPLSVVEAMAAGRIAIVSTAGGNTELIEENVTAFSGYANEDDFEEAMERAWNVRHNWEQMGLEAAKQIAQLVPPSPEKYFTDHLLQFIKG